MFVKTSVRDRLVFFEDFVGLTLIGLLLLLPPANCFPRVYPAILFAANLNYFLPLTTSAIYGAANSSKSAPTRFTAGTICLRKKKIAVLAITFASAPKFCPRCVLILL